MSGTGMDHRKDSALVIRKESISVSPDNALTQPELEPYLIEAFLTLEELDINLFRAHYLLSGHSKTNRVYGGQVIAQALVAATNTVQEHLHMHSLHCYFMLPGDQKKPILYQVDRVQDNRSFSTRVVKAIQHGANIFTAMISFQKEEVDSIMHQSPMPTVPPPEECDYAITFLDKYFNKPDQISNEGKRALEAFRKILDFPTTFDIKLIHPRESIQKWKPGEPVTAQVWVRCSSLLSDTPALHTCVAAFISDITPIGTPIAAHAGHGFDLGMAASLDHTLHLHARNLRMDDWVLYETISTAASNSRALIKGQMWSREGKLLMSTSQEILVREQRKSEEKKT